MSCSGLSLDIDYKLLSRLIMVFIVFTVIGTLSHEMGHYSLAYLAGYQPHLGYGYVDWNTVDYSNIRPFWDKLITLGGPIQTMLTGSIGLLYIVFHQNQFISKPMLSCSEWAWIFIALFWLRQPANLMVWIGKYLYHDNLSLTGDEVELAIQYGLPLWAVIVFTAIVGFWAGSYICLVIIPKPTRMTFILGGLIGGVLGYILWLEILGPIWMP